MWSVARPPMLADKVVALLLLLLQASVKIIANEQAQGATLWHQYHVLLYKYVDTTKQTATSYS